MAPEPVILAKNRLEFLNDEAFRVAPKLLGCFLERIVNGRKIVVRIVETEAYDQTDVASHSYNGQTERTKVMFGEYGRLYVYFTYGMHFCCNVVVGEQGHGAAVLVRAVEPIIGEDYMQQIRRKSGVEVSNGPAKLCQALLIDKTLNGHDLSYQPLKLVAGRELGAKEIIQTTRIGISRGKDVLWRYYIKDNPYVSKT